MCCHNPKSPSGVSAVFDGVFSVSRRTLRARDAVNELAKMLIEEAFALNDQVLCHLACCLSLSSRIPIILSSVFSQCLFPFPVLFLSPGDRQPVIEDISKGIEDADSLVSRDE